LWLPPFVLLVGSTPGQHVAAVDLTEAAWPICPAPNAVGRRLDLFKARIEKRGDRAEINTLR